MSELGPSRGRASSGVRRGLVARLARSGLFTSYKRVSLSAPTASACTALARADARGIDLLGTGPVAAGACPHTRSRSAGRAPCGQCDHRSARGRQGDRYRGAHGLIEHAPLLRHIAPASGRCLLHSACSIQPVDQLHIQRRSLSGTRHDEPTGGRGLVEFERGEASEGVGVTGWLGRVALEARPLTGWSRGHARRVSLGLAKTMLDFRVPFLRVHIESTSGQWTETLVGMWRVFLALHSTRFTAPHRTRVHKSSRAQRCHAVNNLSRG